MSRPSDPPSPSPKQGTDAATPGIAPAEEPASTPFVAPSTSPEAPSRPDGGPAGPAAGKEKDAKSTPVTSGPVVPVQDRFSAPELAPDPPLRWPSLRTPIVLLILMILMTGVVYPGAITLVADVADPVSASYLATLVGENISNPALFWERPSGIDWTPVWNDTVADPNGTGAGDEGPWGPTCPYSPANQCSALMNQTLGYVYQYGLNNTTVPLNLVSQSDSGIDPDIYPDAALVQVPRVVAETGLPFSVVWNLVNDTITQPIAGFVGPSYVNVVTLDGKLLALPQLAGTTPNGTGVGN